MINLQLSEEELEILELALWYIRDSGGETDDRNEKYEQLEAKIAKWTEGLNE